MPAVRSTLVPALAVLISASAFAVDTDVQIHGFASQGYIYTPGDNTFLSPNSNNGGTFDFNEFAVNFGANPIDRLHVGAQLFASTLGKFGKDKVQLDWGYGEYQVPTGSDLVDVSVLAGRVKMSHGLYNDYRDLDMTRTSVFLPTSVYSVPFRDVALAVNGVGVNLGFHPEKVGNFQLYAYLGGQNFEKDGAIADAFISLGGGQFSGVESITVRRVDGINLTWETPLEGLKLKGSIEQANELKINTYATAAIGGAVVNIPIPALLPNYYSSIFGFEYQMGNLTLASEYSLAQAKIIVDASAVGGGENVSELNTQGLYGTASYRFLQHFEGMLGATWDHENTGANTVASRTAGYIAALRWDVTDHWLVKAEFQRNKGTKLASSGTEEYWNLFALKTTFDF